MNIKTIVREIFYILTSGLLILVALELWWPGVILAEFNINIALILWVIVGIILILINEKVEK